MQLVDRAYPIERHQRQGCQNRQDEPTPASLQSTTIARGSVRSFGCRHQHHHRVSSADLGIPKSSAANVMETSLDAARGPCQDLSRSQSRRTGVETTEADTWLERGRTSHQARILRYTTLRGHMLLQRMFQLLRLPAPTARGWLGDDQSKDSNRPSVVAGLTSPPQHSISQIRQHIALRGHRLSPHLVR